MRRFAGLRGVPRSASRTARGTPAARRGAMLWVQDGAGRHRTQSGTMRFFSGFVRAADGTRRFGWIAEDAIAVSDCGTP